VQIGVGPAPGTHFGGKAGSNGASSGGATWSDGGVVSASSGDASESGASEREPPEPGASETGASRPVDASVTTVWAFSLAPSSPHEAATTRIGTRKTS
jgi:hypothetical protein